MKSRIITRKRVPEKEGPNLKNENDEEKNSSVDPNRELEVEKANLRAWNHWGRTWRFDRKNHPPNANTLQLMKIRTLTYLRVYSQIVFSTGGLKGKSVLDIGCGASEYQKWFADSCDELVGVDISTEMLKLCREDRGKAVELVAADALHLPFRDEAFDASMTFQALHHFPNWQKAVFEMVRTAKQVIVYEPNGDSVFHRFMNWTRGALRSEQRFKQIDEDYELVEFRAAGFSPASMMNLLETKGMRAKLFMFGLVPVSWLQKIFRLSPLIMFLVLHFEDLVGEMPLMRSQLGGILVIGRRQMKHGNNK
jgi:SAM-dependent methyltransferase